MGLTENLIETKSEIEALTEFANSVTGGSDVNLGDAVKALADGFGGGGGIDYTEVSVIPSGRSFSIPCDYDKCVIVLMLESSTNLSGGMGYNGITKNAGNIQWTNDGTGFSIIFIDNINLRFSSMGTHTSSTNPRKSEQVVLSERARNIQPHWINGQTQVTGGYYVIPLDGGADNKKIGYQLLGTGTFTEDMTSIITSTPVDASRIKQLRVIIRTDNPPKATAIAFIGSGTQHSIASVAILANQSVSITDIILPEDNDTIGVYGTHGKTSYTPRYGVCYSRKMQNSNILPLDSMATELVGATYEIYALYL